MFIISIQKAVKIWDIKVLTQALRFINPDDMQVRKLQNRETAVSSDIYDISTVKRLVGLAVKFNIVTLISILK